MIFIRHPRDIDRKKKRSSEERKREKVYVRKRLVPGPEILQVTVDRT
jgi:hypothetical protein